MKNLIIHMVYILLIFDVSHAFAEEHGESIKLGTYYVPGVIESEKSGLFIDILEELEAESGLLFSISFAPIKRVQATFRANLLDAYFPELEDHAPEDSCWTYPFAYKRIQAFWLKGNKPAQTLADLKNKTVGIVDGYSYGKDILNFSEINLDSAINDDLNVQKLLAGRLDYILGDERSTWEAIKSIDLDNKITYEKGSAIISLPIFFVFKNEGVNLDRCKKISQALKAIEKRGGFVRFQ